MPYDTYRLYQIQRTKSSAEIRRADEQTARIASAIAALFEVITRRAGPGFDVIVRGHWPRPCEVGECRGHDAAGGTAATGGSLAAGDAAPWPSGWRRRSRCRQRCG